MYEWVIDWTCGARRGSISADGYATKSEALAAGLEYVRGHTIAGEHSLRAGRARR